MNDTYYLAVITNMNVLFTNDTCTSPISRTHTGFHATLLGLLRVRLNLWLFSQPDGLVEILAYVAPSAPMRTILEASGALDDSTVIMVSTLYMIRKVQRRCVNNVVACTTVILMAVQ